MKITVYTRPGCSHCQHTKQLLDDLSLGYDEVDVSEDHDALVKVRDVWGFTQVPVVETEEDVWSGHRPERIRDIEG